VVWRAHPAWLGGHQRRRALQWSAGDVAEWFYTLKVLRKNYKLTPPATEASPGHSSRRRQGAAACLRLRYNGGFDRTRGPA